MNNCCDKCNSNPCSCGGGCKPAQYSCCDFDIQVDPYDANTWIFRNCNCMRRVKIPKINETDTKLSTNYSNATLIYNAEKHTDIVTGAQLGDIINLDELRNVTIDPSLAGHCYELIYHKWENCGDGCKSQADRWQNFNINSEGAKKNGIRYVRGANEYGCPVYLDIPTDTNSYWWGMWRPTDSGQGLEFGYIQPQHVTDLPKNNDGDYMVISQSANGKPIYGPLKLPNPFEGAYQFTTRVANPSGSTYFLPNSTSTDEFLIVPDSNPNWRAPADGIISVDYCVNPYNQGAGMYEIDVTPMLNTQNWSEAMEYVDSSHSTWTFTTGGQYVSESCHRIILVHKGETMKLHARITTGAGHTGQWRVHAVRATYIPFGLA